MLSDASATLLSVSVERKSPATPRAPPRPLFEPNWLHRWLCKDCIPRATEEPNADSSPAEQASADTRALREVAANATEPDEEGVAELLAIAQDTVEDERARGRALDAKSGRMLGFSGLILSLNLAVAKPLFDADLGTVGKPIVLVLFFVTVVSLLVAVLLAIAGVLSPQRYRGFGRDQLRKFTEPETQAMTRLVVHQSMLGAVADMIDQNRPLNDCKARITKLVGRWLAIAFIAVAALAIVIGISEIGG